MDQADLLALLPLLLLSGAALALLVAVAYRPEGNGPAILSALGFAVSLAALPAARAVGVRQVGPLLRVDGSALFFTGVLLAAGLAISLLSACSLPKGGGRDDGVRRGEFHLLLLLATLGALTLALADHFAAVAIGLELLSVPLFALIAYGARSPNRLEAGIKYLLLSGLSSALLLFGLALIYASSGALGFAGVGEALAGMDRPDPYLLAGFALLVAGAGFKLSLVPFHMWTPDVYQGAPPPVGAFIATLSKGAVVALLLHLFTRAGGYALDSVLLTVVLIAVASMVAGNLLALMQENVKRLLGYSSIAHLGYLLVAFIAGGTIAVEAVSYYAAAYIATMVGAFGVVTFLSGSEGEEAEEFDHYRGLFWRHPWLASIFALMLLSLAGIPLTAGFIGKFYAVAMAVGAGAWLLLAALIVGSIIGLYYYLRLVVVLFATEPAPLPPAEPPRLLVPWMVLAAVAVAVLWLGILPESVMELLQMGGGG